MSSKSDKAKGAFFGSTERELEQFFVGLGEVSFGEDAVTFKNYPFDKSSASVKIEITSKDIINICTKTAPPTIRVGDELIFVSAEHRQELNDFAVRHKIPVVDRVELWDWILEPFLDTEFPKEQEDRTYWLLERYALSRQEVDLLRKTVKDQMMKYNFDTMIWEWVTFGALDVLTAMRPKLTPEDFNSFYKQVIEIAIRPDSMNKCDITNS
ncbi:hypothetical protein [Paraflavitalea sp. CAU 1676]|uniref:hypothetical protein n=1 Tax=Paraflavitalea sp. CAU 1676 TaxID=3032598 RepID=UPI0023DB6545|nr:hypothetical protein [Paraflavitalea sp. CAU 1676]MDF2188085.1 hypothetical protein [Paraflavitalea sp. CAU 1676]